MNKSNKVFPRGPWAGGEDGAGTKGSTRRCGRRCNGAVHYTEDRLRAEMRLN